MSKTALLEVPKPARPVPSREFKVVWAHRETPSCCSGTIIWTDQRIAALLAEIRERIGIELLATTCGTAPAAGFLISTFFWLRKHEPEALERTVTLLTPKDYVRFRLTDELSTDQSDSAARKIFNVRKRVWADELIERLEFPRSIFPKVHPSALLDGVFFSLRQIIDAIVGCGAELKRLVASGNGLASPLWRQVLADVLCQGKGQARLGTGRRWSRTDSGDGNWCDQRLRRRAAI